MHKLKILFVLFLTISSSLTLIAQSQAAFRSIIYPRSISAGGLGEQGVASGNVADAMQYNPANLFYTDKFSFSFFNNPWNILGDHIPIVVANTSMKLKNDAAVGIDYTYRNFGEVTYVAISQNPNGYEDLSTIHMYERSIAAGYAMPIGESFAVGAQARYIWMPFTKENYIQHLLISAGISAAPEIFSKRMIIGVSLIDFSTAIDYEYNTIDINGNEVKRENADSPPSQLNLGMSGSIITNDYFDVSLSLGAMKPIVKRNGPPDYDGQSSFSALVNSWSEFPNDVTAQAGLGFLWHPFDLGAGVSFFQEIYLGYFTVGPAEYLNSYMTHGVSLGVQVNGIKASAGYAGRWHSYYYNNSFFAWDFPWETVQFNLSTNMDMFGGDFESHVSNYSPLNIILYGGYTYGDAIGKMKKIGYISLSTKDTWSLESDFYIDSNSALLTAIRYSKAIQSYSLNPVLQMLEIETFSLESGYRYHPLDVLHPFFIQVSLGILRMNPVLKTYPRYYYQTFSELAIGFVFPIANTGIVLLPKAGFKTIFRKEFLNPDRLGGYNQYTFGVNIGYEL